MATYIDTDAGLQRAAQCLHARPRVSLDLETTGLDPLKDSILLVGIDEYAIDGRLDLDPLKPLIEDNDVGKVIFNASFDGMFLQRRGMLPYRVWDPMIGAMLLKCGLHSLPGTFTLENLLHVCLGITLPPGKHDMQMSFVGVDPQLWVPSQEQIEYVCSDTQWLTRLSDYMQDRVEQCGLMAVWRLENAVTQVVAQMQIQGIPLNVPAYTSALVGWEREFEKIEDELQGTLTPPILEVRRRDAETKATTFALWELDHEVAWANWEKEFDTIYPDASRGERRKELQARDRAWRANGHLRPDPPRIDTGPINLGSAVQVKLALKEVGISLLDKKRASILGAKVGQGVEIQAMLNQLAQYSKLDKQLGTYGRPMLDNMDPDNRIRCRFNQIIATGRRSSSKFHDDARDTHKGANLQNFPKPSRDLVQPLPGRKFVIGDYSQIELRVAAEYALQRNPQADDALIRAFRHGSDPHAEMAAVAFGLDLQDLEARVKAGDETAVKQRWAGKTTNFSALFGIAGKTLAVRIHEMLLAQVPDYMVALTDTDVKNAKLLLEAFRSMNPTILACLDDWRRQALSLGYTTTMSGRRRYFPLPARSDPDYHSRRGKIEREAGNQPIQGTSADITKLAEIQIQRAFHKNRMPAALINSVHDESMVETDARYAQRTRVIVEYHMTAAYRQWIKRVPCDVKVVIGETWQH